jgi:hypothetical protein
MKQAEGQTYLPIMCLFASTGRNTHNTLLLHKHDLKRETP